jgi:hypothetical protein
MNLSLGEAAVQTLSAPSSDDDLELALRVAEGVEDLLHNPN